MVFKKIFWTVIKKKLIISKVIFSKTSILKTTLFNINYATFKQAKARNCKRIT